ncbi:hypothetical protein SDC9_06266 [bioreactor metagenome]|uniref:Uncharacterized protein n=1 Tax=bioreactor metagenome TaxID=1076179 RepID=A0A644T1C9_9ZZZZ
MTNVRASTSPPTAKAPITRKSDVPREREGRAKLERPGGTPGPFPLRGCGRSVGVDRRRLARLAQPRTAQQQHQRHRGKGHPHHRLEVVEIAHHRRLLGDELVDDRPDRAVTVFQRQHLQRAGKRPVRQLGEIGVERRDLLHQLGVVDLRVAGQQQRHHRDPDRRADVAHQTVKRRRIAAEARLDRGEGDGRERHEDKAQPEALHEARDHHQPRVHLRAEAGHDVERERGQQQPGHHQKARVEHPQQLARCHHHDHRADAAWRHHHAHGDHRIAEQARQHRRQQRQRGEQDDADDEDEHEPGGEVAVEEHPRVEERVLGTDDPDHEDPESRERDGELDPDLGRVEPVDLAAAVEHQLQRANPDAERSEAEEVELPQPPAHLRQVGHAARERHRPERHVDVEHPPPVEGLGQVAAEGGADDRADHDPRAPHRHRRAVLFLRVDVEQEGLAERHDRGAEDALRHAEQHHRLEAPGDAAEHRGQDEARHRGDEDLLAAEALRHPARQRRDDRRGDDIGGQHPVDRVRGRAEVGAHRRQGDVRDGGVEHLHDRREHQREGDQPVVLDLARGGDGGGWHGLVLRRRAMREERPETGLGLGVDGDRGGETRAQAVQIRALGQPQPHRHALRHLHPVAGGVLRRQDRELGPGARAHGFDRGGVAAVREGVELDLRGLARAHAADLGFLEIRLDPGVAGFDQREQRGAGGDELAGLEAVGPVDHAVGRRLHRGQRQVVGRLVARHDRRLHGGVVVGGDLGVAAERGECRLDALLRGGERFTGGFRIVPCRVERRFGAGAAAGDLLLPLQLGVEVVDAVLCDLRLGKRDPVGGAQLLDAEPGLRQGRLGLGEGELVGFGGDAEQLLPGLHLRAVGDEDLGHAARQVRGDRDPRLADCGVLGVLVAPGIEPDPGAADHQRQRQRGHQPFLRFFLNVLSGHLAPRGCRKG